MEVKAGEQASTPFNALASCAWSYSVRRYLRDSC